MSTNIPMEETIKYIIKKSYVSWHEFVGNWLLEDYRHQRRSRTAATSKMERFVIVVNGLKPLTSIIRCSILDIAAVLYPPWVSLATECTFNFNRRFLKQVNGSTMCGPIYATFSGIYMVKIENNIRGKLGDTALFNRLNNYLNIKLSIELSPRKFLNTKFINISGFYKVNVNRKSTKLSSP